MMSAFVRPVGIGQDEMRMLNFRRQGAPLMDNASRDSASGRAIERRPIVEASDNMTASPVP